MSNAIEEPNQSSDCNRNKRRVEETQFSGSDWKRQIAFVDRFLVCYLLRDFRNEPFEINLQKHYALACTDNDTSVSLRQLQLIDSCPGRSAIVTMNECTSAFSRFITNRVAFSCRSYPFNYDRNALKISRSHRHLDLLINIQRSLTHYR